MDACKAGDALAGAEAMVACGIGCRRGASVGDIEMVIGLARQASRCDDDIHVIATEASKLDERGLQEAARKLGVKLVGFGSDELATVAGQVLTVSAAALEHKGVASVAEGAALLGAGANGRLLAPRSAVPMATCALASGEAKAR